MRTRFKPASVVLAVLAALLIAAPVAAADPWLTFKQSGTSAFAFDQVCTENPNRTVTCEGESIDVFDGTTRQTGQPTASGDRVCYSQFTDTFNPRTGEGESSGVFGCALDAGTLTIDNLTSITLAPTVIELTALECDSTGLHGVAGRHDARCTARGRASDRSCPRRVGSRSTTAPASRSTPTEAAYRQATFARLDRGHPGHDGPKEPSPSGHPAPSDRCPRPWRGT